MKCESVRENLSAYFDDELSKPEKTAVREHLKLCDGCQAELAMFESLSVIVQTPSQPVSVLPSWESIAAELDKNQITKTVEVKRSWRPVAAGLLALAASMLLIFGTNRFASTPTQNVTLSNFATINLKPVIESFAHTPAQALDTLATQLHSIQAVPDAKSVVEKHAAHVHITSVLPKISLLNDSKLISTKTIAFSSCKCVNGVCTCGPDACNCTACVCQRADGSSYMMIEHCKSQDVNFGDLATRLIDIDGKQVEAIVSGKQTTFSWSGEHNRFTAIGLKDDQEAGQLIARN